MEELNFPFIHADIVGIAKGSKLLNKKVIVYPVITMIR